MTSYDLHLKPNKLLRCEYIKSKRRPTFLGLVAGVASELVGAFTAEAV